MTKGSSGELCMACGVCMCCTYVCVRVCVRAGDTHCIVLSACISVWPFGVAVNLYGKHLLTVTIHYLI